MDNIPAVVQPEEVQLTATLPHEMIVAQQSLITWVDGKLILLRSDSDELLQAYEHAKKNKWKSGVLKKHYDKSVKTITYYEKLKAAFLEGYYIVPNFDLEIFLIRTKKKKPLAMVTWSSWSDNKGQEPELLPVGEGEYKNNRPIVHQGPENTETRKRKFWAHSWDEIEFPINMAKPQIMEAVSKAMQQKIFDRIGVFPGTRRKDDPVILGQIILKEGQYKTRLVSFMIAWHIDSRAL